MKEAIIIYEWWTVRDVDVMQPLRVFTNKNTANDFLNFSRLTNHKKTFGFEIIELDESIIEDSKE